MKDNFKTFYFTTIIFLCLVIFICSIQGLFAQELPPVSKYSTEIYGADNQNWSITQTQDKDIFFANSKGLLKFDGEKWDLYSSPNKTILRSVFAENNRVYSGAYMEFGYWEKKANNQYEYSSLSEDLELIEDEQFWKIDKIDQYIVFQSLDAIYLYDSTSNTFDVISSEQGISKMMIIDNLLYYHKINEGIFKLVNGEEVPVNTTDFFKNSLVVNMYKLQNELYVQTQFNGIINLETNDNYLPKNFLETWPNLSVYNSIQVDNGDIYLGTISHGLMKLSEGEIQFHLNQQNTLSNNTVLSLFEDTEQNIWLGLDNGINSVNVASNIKIFNDGNGDLGTVYASINHKDTIYLGTNQGLFFQDKESGTFKFIEGTKGQVWSLFEFENSLFCGHNLGTFVINNNQAKLLNKKMQGTWLFKAIDENTIVSGNYNGLHLYKKVNEEWLYQNKIKGFNISTKYFEFLDQNSILVNHEYKGIYKLQLNDSLTEVLSFEKDVSVPKGLFSSIITYQDKVLYAYKKGIYAYNTTKEKFQKDSTLSSIYENNEYTSGRLVKTSDGKVWAFSKSDIAILSPSSLKDKYILDNIPINHDSRHQISGYENVSLVGPNTYLLGSSNGYLKLKLNSFERPKPEVFFTDIFSKSKDNENIESVDEEPRTFKKSKNYLDFHFTTYNYNSIFKNEYQYKLENYNNWSNWSTNSNISFKNLPYGDYTFKVRSRIGKDNVSETISYAFTIQKPAYLTNEMIGFYALILLIIILIVHFVYKQYYKQQKKKLQEKANQELELKELEAQRKIMRINNDKLKQDIENKNRELAISTMSLIKKNEFLAAIKTDLKQVNVKDQKLEKVLKTINKNLNNSDDWSFFEEAFNNADKDFLKKIKSKHPSLTPNDLRLCAYLRLNLTSKEIAPLFNISTRSVEVKRYRLRKKMDLPREASLTNYILEI
ncbi:helix-turn-helix and ligand-binding sensor domain-containing protein [Psychroflexus planctonicus]|uniref:HTH luxR-type domain-containing protein n=1 Tax=Psychroflexus planctonicus TaxID=1526575 RepID=A0ABQ1SL79_9FLAO|nr:triple tyrosine motif-containing protein [Psychroflexus planctonicus]GGE40191.1 hypothetical protein GCM10010832_20450 [Psychroflexus planctonicus]